MMESTTGKENALFSAEKTEVENLEAVDGKV